MRRQLLLPKGSNVLPTIPTLEDPRQRPKATPAEAGSLLLGRMGDEVATAPGAQLKRIEDSVGTQLERINEDSTLVRNSNA